MHSLGKMAAVLCCGMQLAHADPVALFNGYNLDGWQVVGVGKWSVMDHAIVGSGSDDGFLASDKDYGNFHLQAEFWVDATTNSGIFIRCKDRSRIDPGTCFELNIWDKHPQQEARTGAIVMHFMPPMAQVETVGRWNTYEVTAKGADIEVKVNGVTTATIDNANPTEGFIALQHWEDGTVQFRKLELDAL